MKVYVAHNFAARLWLRENVVPVIEGAGHLVTSRWIKEELHVLQGYATQGAIEDLEDIDAASSIILFVDQYSEKPGKGKYFELGYALRAGKRCILIGEDRSCVFYNLPNMRVAKTIEQAIFYL